MIGLIILGLMTVYLLVSILITRKAVSWAKAHNRKPWLWAGLAAFVMYNLVFWDFLPTLVVHKYYCETKAGFWIYKTPEQWLKENPELKAESLKPSGKEFDVMPSEVWYPGTPNALIATKINSRVAKAFGQEVIESVLPIWKEKEYFIDTVTNKKLAELVDFSSGYGNPMTTGGLLGFKAWLQKDGCNVADTSRVHITNYLKELVSLGEKNH